MKCSATYRFSLFAVIPSVQGTFANISTRHHLPQELHGAERFHQLAPASLALLLIHPFQNTSVANTGHPQSSIERVSQGHVTASLAWPQWEIVAVFTRVGLSGHCDLLKTPSHRTQLL